MGDHRLACGDSHDPAVIADLLRGDTPDVAVLDPPFDIGNRWVMHLRDPCIVFGQARHIRQIPKNLWRFERIIAKGYGHRCATTHIVHRHAIVAQCGSVKKLPLDPRSWPSIVAAPKSLRHLHEKPLSLLIEHLALWTPDWRIVFDPYAGSGVVFIAAQLLGRRCYGIERDYRQCLKIVRRVRALAPAA
jgi:hypothetical protein